jgi:ATP-binding cassette subfamily B protein
MIKDSSEQSSVKNYVPVESYDRIEKYGHYLWKFIMLAPFRSLLIALASAVWFGLPLVAGLLIRLFFDSLSGQSGTSMHYWIIAVLFFLARGGQGIWWIGTGAIAEYHLAVVAYLVRRNLFRHILEKTHSQLSPGEFLNRFEDDAQSVADPVFHATYGGGQIIAISVTFWVLLRINAPLTIIAFLTPLLTYGIMKGLGPLIQRAHQGARGASEVVSLCLTDLLTNVRAFQVAGAESSVLQCFTLLSQDRRKTAVRSTLITEISSALNHAAISITTGLMLVVVALRFRNLSPGDFALFASYVTFGGGVIGEVADWLAAMMTSIRRASVSMKRLWELMAPGYQHALVDTSPPYLRGKLVKSPIRELDSVPPFSELSVSGCDAGREELIPHHEKSTLLVKKGEIVVITGRVGSGKSLLLETILGLSNVSGCEVSWNKQIIEDRKAWFIPPRCGHVSQSPHIFSATLRDNILLGFPADELAVEKAVWEAVLEQDVDNLESGLETLIGSRGVNLSGGQIQRTAAARAFVRQPQLLILDDISSALDVDTERVLWDRLFSRVLRPTCLIVSHRRSVLQRADMVVVMKDGKVEDSGSLDDLLQRCLEMQYLWQVSGSENLDE